MKNLAQYISWLAASLLMAMIVIGFIMSPLLLIWLINAIFNTGTPYSFESWLASIIILLIIKISIGYFKSN
jgi:hypothetical protein